MFAFARKLTTHKPDLWATLSILSRTVPLVARATSYSHERILKRDDRN